MKKKKTYSPGNFPLVIIMSVRILKSTFGFLFIVLVFSVLVTLAIWQYQRWQWKESLLDEIATQFSYPAQNFTTDTPAVQWRPYVIAGQWMPHFVLKGTATYQNQSGFKLLQGFRLANTQHYFLVDRGWVPLVAQDLDHPIWQDNLLAQGRAEFTALATDLLPPHLFTPAAHGQILYAFDQDFLAEKFPYELTSQIWFVLPQTDPGSDHQTQTQADLPDQLPVQLPVQLPPPVDLPNNHFSYMLTWGSLAIIWLVIMLPLWYRIHFRG